jgi:hypothetical protein
MAYPPWLEIGGLGLKETPLWRISIAWAFCDGMSVLKKSALGEQCRYF